MTSIRNAARGSSAALGFTLVMAPALAQVSPALDRISVSAGGYRAKPILNARVASPEGSVATGDIGHDAEFMPRVKADILLFDSQGLSFDYYRLKRDFASSGSFALDSRRSFNGAQLSGKVEFAKAAYKWWFGSGNTVFGLGAGAAYYKLSADGTARFTVDGSPATARASADIDAVAPVLDLGLRHAITPNLRLFAEASGVHKGWGGTRGSLYNAALGAEFFPLKNVGVVVSYDYSNVTLRRDDQFRTDLKMNFHGPSAFVKVRF